MADYLIYWPNYRQDRKRYELGPDNPLVDWRTSQERLHRSFQSGDRFWFITAGNSFGGDVPTAAYLVNMFVAGEMRANSGDDPNYPGNEFRYTVLAADNSARWIDPPILVDELVRPDGHVAEEHIGILLQGGPRRLNDDVAMAFERLVPAG